MAKKKKGWWRTLLEQCRTRRTWHFLAWLAGGAGVLFFWLVPNFHDPYLRVPGSIYSVALDCIPKSLQVNTRTDYAVAKQVKIVLVDANGKISPTSFGVVLAANEPGSHQSSQILLPSSTQSNASLELKRLGLGARALLIVEFTRVPYLDIDSVALVSSEYPELQACPKTLVGDKLLSNGLPPGSRLMHFVLPQEKVSDFIFLANESLGALTLGGLLLTICWLIGQFGQGMWSLYVTPDDVHKQNAADGTNSRKSVAPDYQPIDFVYGKFELRERRLAFVKVLGPAVGFLLTVSSLVAGLHPSTQVAQDTFSFVSSLQLALVATFLGLLTRILAEFAIRVHWAVADRVLLLVTPVSYGSK